MSLREVRSALTAPSASGTLEKRPFAHLLLYAHERCLSGTIDFTGPDGDARVVFAGGKPVKIAAAGDTMDARLDTVFGLGHATQFAYFDGVDGLADEPVQRVEPLPAIWRGIRRATPWAHVRAALARYEGSRVKLSSAFEPSELGFGPIEVAMLDGLRAGPADLDDLLGTERGASGEAECLIYFLLITKRVDVLATSSERPQSSRSPSPLFPSASPRPNYTSDAAPRPSGVPSGIESSRERMSTSPPSSLRSSTRPVSAASANALLVALNHRRAAIREREARIDQETDFEVLGVGPSATAQEVHLAFFALTKAWHPDTLPPGLANLKDACSRVFSRMTQADQRLCDPGRRALYVRELEQGTNAAAQEVLRGPLEAAISFQSADAHLKRGSVVEAEAECRRALSLDPEPLEYSALLLWLEALKPVNQDAGKTASYIEQLAALISKDTECERAFLYRGMLYKRLGEDPHAMSDFKNACLLNPENIDAQREVRSYATRGVKSIAPGRKSAASSSPRLSVTSGMIEKLFKK